MRYRTRSEAQTIALAKHLARRLKGGDVVLLQGELGSGKTTFVRGLAAAFGIHERITSPTFVLLHVHRVTRYRLHVTRFVHVDAYRVKRARELKDVGLADWLGRPDTIVVVEWGEKIKTLLKGVRPIIVKFGYGKKMDERIITPPPKTLPQPS